MSSYNLAQLARLEPNYLARYGLKTAPFSTTHDDRFLYLDAERQQRLHMLQHLTQYSHLLLIVTGEHGVGKTSLKQRFVNGLDERWLISQVDAHPMMDANELLASVAQGFGLFDVPLTPDALQDNLYQYLAGLQDRDTIPLLIVDDAHELPQDALEALFLLADAEASEGNLLRTILFCEPAINRMLESVAIQALQERITHNMEIPPFDEEHTAEYLKHRLAVAGLSSPSPFSPRDVKRIFKASEGIPEKINEAAHLILNGDDVDKHALEDEAPQQQATLNVQRIMLGAIAVIIITSVLLWQDEINEFFSATDTAPSETTGQVQMPPVASIDTAPAAVGEKVIELDLQQQPEVAASDREAQVPTDQDAEVEQDVLAQPESTEPVTSKPAETVTASGPETETTVTAEAVAPMLEITGIEPVPVPASTEPQTLTVIGNGFSGNTQVIVAWTGNQKTLPAERVEFIDRSSLKIELTVGATPDTWTVTLQDPLSDQKAVTTFEVRAASQPVATAKPPVQKPVQKQVQKYNLDWLRQQPPQHVTLQLLASRQKANLETYVNQHQLADKTVLFESRRDGRPWFALVHGSFATREAAEQASRTLPTDIKPWIRSFASIQQALLDPDAPSASAAEQAIIDKTVPAAVDIRQYAAWLWDQDPSDYTLQLLAGRNESAVQAYMQKHQLLGKAVYYRTRRDGQPWFVLVAGSYPDRDAAIRASRDLPAELRKSEPWPRTIASIHADLYRN